MLFYDGRFSQPMVWTLGLLIGTTVITNPAIAATPVDSIQDGPVVNGGTYYNTFLGKTTFTNSSGGGLWLKAGTNIRGLEINNGQLTNNGGTFHFYAPNNVVRLDGKINVSGLVNGSGAYLGNGGKVFVDSGYLFQNGNIFANGLNGGLVQVNVAGMTVGSGARIDAKGFGGNGGAVLFASNGPVDIRRNAVITTSGKVASMVDTNVIVITGSLVNQEGVLNANGVSLGGSSRGGTIQLTASGQSDFTGMKEALTAATGAPGSHAISPQERAFLLQRNDALIHNFDGDVRVGRTNNGSTPVVTANGTGGTADPINDHTTGSSIPRAGDGGTIVISAVRDILHEGQMQANGATGKSATTPVAGGYGGTLTWLARRNINNSGAIQVDGSNGGDGPQAQNAAGGNGGLAAFSYGNVMQNSGSVAVIGGRGGGGHNIVQDGAGGNGGLIVLSGNQNPVGNGFLIANGGLRGNLKNFDFGGVPGTIVVPNPLIIQNTQHADQREFINGVPVIKPVSEATQANELLTHAENLIYLGRGIGGQSPLNVFDRLSIATLRSVVDPTGTLGLARQEITVKARPDDTMDKYVYRNWMIGSIGPNTPLDLTPPITGIPFAPLSNLTNLSSMNLVSVVNKDDISVGNNASSNFWMMGNIGLLSGRRLHLMAEGSITNTTDLGVINDGSSGGSIVLAATDSIRIGNGVYGTLFAPGAGHAGTMILKAKKDITIAGRQLFDAIVNSTGGLIGGTSLFQAGRNFSFGNSDISTAGDVQGGWLNVRAGNNLLTNGYIVASGSRGGGGFVALHADNSLLNTNNIAASGRTQGGTIMLTAGDLNPNNNQRVGITSLPVQLQGFGIPGLMPPLTSVFLNANGQQSESVFNLGNLDVRANLIGCNTGKIYLGGNNQVVLGGSNQGVAYNRIPISYQQITGSSDPNSAFQAAFNWATNAGEKIYAVVGQKIPGGSNGGSRTASEIVEVEAGPNGQAPNVNPVQPGQGASVPTDFELQSNHPPF